MPEPVVGDPWLNLAADLVTMALKMLESPTKEEEATAISKGYRSAEEEAMEFLQSSLADHIISAIMSDMTPDEYLQRGLDRIYGPGVYKVVPAESDEFPKRIPRGRGRPKRKIEPAPDGSIKLRFGGNDVIVLRI